MPSGHSKTTWGGKKINNFRPPKNYLFFVFSSYIWAEFGQNLAEFGRNVGGIWEKFGQNLSRIWAEFGSEFGQNLGQNLLSSEGAMLEACPFGLEPQGPC